MTQDKLDHYRKSWALHSAEWLTATATSELYKVRFSNASNEMAVLKILTSTGKADERNAVVALEAFDGQGAVRLLRHDAGAQLLEYADGESLLELVQRGNDAEATKIIAALLKTLHSASPRTSESLTPLRWRFRSLFSTATASAHKSFKRAARIAQVLLDSQKNVCLLHGDIHHENVIQSKRGWLAIDPKGLVGEKTYDAANTLCNPVSMPNLVLKEGRIRKNAELLSRELNIDSERLLAFTFVHAALSASWHQDDRHYEHFALAGGLVVLLDNMVPHFN